MRSLVASLALLTACGASPDRIDGALAPVDVQLAPSEDGRSVTLSSQSTVEGVTGGAVLYGDGAKAHFGMQDYSCDVRTTSGEVSTDVESDDGSVVVVEDSAEDLVLVSGDESLRLVRTIGVSVVRGTNDWAETKVVMRDLVAARVAEGGAALLFEESGECQVAWQELPDPGHDSHGRTTVARDLQDRVSLDASACARGLMVSDPASGALWVSSDEALYSVTREGAVAIGAPVDALSWDAASETLVASVGDRVELRTTEGVLLDVFRFEGEVLSALMVGDLILATWQSDGDGHLSAVHPSDGAILRDRGYSWSAPTLVGVSDEGEKIALLRGDRLEIIRVELR